MDGTQTFTVTVEPAEVNPERVEQIFELGTLLLVGAVLIYCIRQLGKIFEVHHEKD